MLGDVPLTELARHAAAVQAVDPAALRQAADALADPTAASVVVVGDAKTFLPAMRKQFPNLQVIPQAALRLDSVELN